MTDKAIIYEDNNLLVINKAAGVVSQRSDKGASVLSLYGKELLPVHRLDKEAFGLLVLAKTPLAASELSKQIVGGILHKEYYIIIEGSTETDCGEYRDYLFHDKTKNKSYVVRGERKGVKEAVLQYSKIATIAADVGTLSLLRVVLLTGRTHQIRVQFSSRGTPIIGDTKYGSKSIAPLALFANKLSFNLPKTNRSVSFILDRPDIFPWNTFEAEL